MPATIWKILNKNSPGTSTTFAADDWDMPGRYFNDFDFTATAPTSIKTNTRYWDNRLRVWNPAKTFSYNIRSLALTANRDVTLPLLTSNDEFVMLLHTQTLQNKIMNLANNTFTSTAATTGGIPKHDGTKYVNIARGSAGQVPTVNVGGTDWTWADATAINVADNVVGTTKIVNGAVTNDKLATDAVSGTKILNGSIGDEKLLQILDAAKLPDGLFYANPQSKSVGWFNNRHATAHNGIFNGICVSTGTFNPFSVAAGLHGRYFSGSTVGNQAGFRTNVVVAERQHNFKLKGAFSLNDATNIKCFIGFVNDTANFRSGVNPLDVLSGIGIWVDTTNSTNFRIAHNDGVGTTVHDDWSTPTALNTSTHTFEIRADNTNTRFQADIDGLATYTVTTEIPAASTEMALQVWVETSTTAFREIRLAYLVFEGAAPAI